MRYIQDDIGTVVAAMRDGGDVPYYMYGHRLEIARALKAKDSNPEEKNAKYPLIALRFDIPESEDGGYVQYKDINIIIVDFTNKNYSAAERFTNVIKPVLVPLYDKFMLELRNSGLFTWPNYQKLPKHQRIFRPFWGTPGEERNEKYIFSDPLDAIEIVGLEINSTNKKC